jgi:hypothetical protein
MYQHWKCANVKQIYLGHVFSGGSCITMDCIPIDDHSSLEMISMLALVSVDLLFCSTFTKPQKIVDDSHHVIKYYYWILELFILKTCMLCCDLHQMDSLIEKSMGSATQKRMPRKQSHGLVTMDISV